MDMWLVAAAAGAGYVAKHWQNLLKDRDSLSELSSGGSTFEKPESPPSIQQLNNKSCPSHSLAQRKKLGGDVSMEREDVSDTNFSEMSRSDGASVPEVACTSGFDGENLINLGNNEDCNLLSISSLPPGLLRNENLHENGDQSRVNDDSSGDLLPEPSTGELGSFHGSSWKRSSLRSKLSCGNIVKPLSSLESCLMAQLYKEHVEMEEYVLSSLPSPSAPTMRPLLVTDGSRIISRASGDCFSAQIVMKEKKLHREPYSNEKEAVFGVPPLPHIGTAELPSKVKLKTGKDWGGRLGSSTKVVNGKNFHSLGGSTDGTLLFCLGFSVGIISSVMANKREVDKLKEVLKQTENLVQDLQEELEMKDSLTMKELSDENYESQDTREHSFHNRASNDFSPQQDMDKSTKYDANEPYDYKSEENSESISRIEAELEAELERLELSMSSSRLKRGVSDLVEIDPDFEAEFVQGELRANMVGALSDSDPDTTSTSTTHSANYAVSPRELSLRLHEVIQSRLEERIKELETALQNGQQKVHLMELDHTNSWRDFSNKELGSSSAHEIPIAIEESNSIARPLIINLSEEALEAYNEAYEELMKINESEEEDLPSGVGQNGEENTCMPHCTIRKDKTSRKCGPPNVRTWEEHISRVQRLNASNVSGDEYSDCDDEMEKLLIQQIVEKTKKGSPVVLNAQRVLMSNYENVH